MYDEAARKTAKIEGAQHRAQLEKEGILGLKRAVRIIAEPYSKSAATELAPHRKIVHLIRHGQAFHNFLADIYREHGKEFDSTGYAGKPADSPYMRPEVLDPPLTALGRQQAKALQSRCKELTGIDLVVVSPMRRAVETAMLAFAQAVENKGLHFLGHQDVTECSGKNICDKRRDMNEVKADFPAVDWTQIGAEEDPLWSEARETPHVLSDRTYSFLLWLRDRPEKEIAVATHSATLFNMLNTTIECIDADLADWFLTGELRSVILEFTERNGNEGQESPTKRQRCE